MTVFTAMLHDAYRELNARKLFWITLVLSAVVVAAFFFITIDENGLRILFWDTDFISTKTIDREVFYKSLFVSMGLGFWLTWIAAILALISTAGIFPEFISGGSIDMVLAKPIGRMRLFLYKYIGGLLFVALQVTVFCTMSFLWLGFKSGAWEVGIFLGIPLVVLFFSYLFGVCVLFGVLTRSTIAALLLTLLFWFMLFILHAGEVSVQSFEIMTEKRVELLQREHDHLESLIENGRASAERDEVKTRALDSRTARLATITEKLEKAQGTEGKLDLVHNLIYGVKTFLPKTTETVQLLERSLISTAELPDPESNEQQTVWEDEFNPDMADVQQEQVDRLRERSVFWIIGTSLLFELAVLSLACWKFVRRDF